MGVTLQPTSTDYYDLLLSLRPTGPAWPQDDDFLRAIADSLTRAHQRSLTLVEEADPRTTVELLAAWERNAGLPDPCSGPAETLRGRRAVLVQRLTSRGGQSRAFYIALAEALGYRIRIFEYQPARAGVACAGDPMYGQDWSFVWRIHAPSTTIAYARAGQMAAGEPLASWGNTLLQCVIARTAPAHTLPIFSFWTVWDGAETVWDDDTTIWD